MNQKPTLNDLSRAECIAIRRLGQLIGFETPEHRYFQDIRGQWRRAKKLHPLTRRDRDRNRDINDWDLGNERSLPRYTLIPVDESEVRAKLRNSKGQ